jgi:ligand-binding sensor domain-containing protein
MHTPVYAQHPAAWQITDEDGLPSMDAYSVHQDTQGYIWFATELGICRYDGTSFKTFPTPMARSKAMSNLKEDKKGRIWFMNFSNQIFYIENSQAKELKIPDSIKINRIHELSINLKNDYVYIQDSGKVLEYRPKTKQWSIISLDAKLKTVTGMAQDQQGNMWYYEQNKVLWKQAVGRQPEVALNQRIPVTDKILFLGDIWTLGKHTGHFRRIKDDKVEYPFAKYANFLKQMPTTNLKRDREGNYWILGFDGAYCFSADFKPFRGGLHFFPGTAVSDMFQDREGNYWFTTLRSGVYFMPAKEVLYYNDENSVLEDNRINALAMNQKGELFLGGTNGKVSVFDPITQSITFQHDIGEIKEIEALIYNPFKRQLYVSCNGFKIFRENEVNWWKFYVKDNYRQAPIYIQPDGGVAGSAPKSFTFIDKDHIASASSAGIDIIRLAPRPNEQPSLTPEFRAANRSSRGSKGYLPYTKYNPYLLRLRSGRARAVWGDSINQRIWAGYHDGLYYYDLKDGKSKQIIDKQNKHGIYALSITQTPNGLVWVGTMEHGLYGIRDTTILFHYDQGSGLANNYCKVVRPDGNKLWVGTSKGIHLIDPTNTKFDLFNKQDGLVTNEIRDLLIKGNEVWVATTKGLLVFDKTQMRQNTIAPPIHITGVSILDEAVPHKDSYELAYNQNSVRIDFKGLAYRSRGTFVYKYRMKGLDSTWTISNSTNNFVRYSAIPAGSYEFEVKAINEDGIESAGIAVIQFKVNKHYTQTWWFYLLVILASLSVISAFFLLRIRNIQSENNIKQALRSSQLSALKVQMNPHFIFNALNSIQEFILLNEKRLANAFLGKFADLMRLTLDMSNEDLVGLVEELKVLKLYLELEAIRFEDTFAYEIKVGDSIDPEEISIPSMLIQPYVENAIKHGLLHKKNERKLLIQFTKNDEGDLLCCRVEDNGIGRKKSWELKAKRKTYHKSFAMSATQKRLELLNHGRKESIMVHIEDLEDNKGEALGTVVHLKIPIDSTFN